MPRRDGNGKQLSGAAQRHLVAAAYPDTADCDDLKARLAPLGLPSADPLEAIGWATRVAAHVCYDSINGPMSLIANSRRKAILESIKVIGLTNSQAVLKARLLRIEQELGLSDTDSKSSLEPSGSDDPSIRSNN